MMKLVGRSLVVALSLLAITGCAGKKVTRVASDSTIDLSGKWNDADSRLVAEEMLKDCLDRPWYQPYQTSGKIPRIIVGEVRNKSHEHISVNTFVNDMQRVLINSGKVEFVADASERGQLRTEVESQQTNSTAESRKEKFQESGAELMLTGEINSIVDQEGDESVVFYQVDLELINLQTHRKLWIGNKKIKKFVDRASLKL